MAVRVGLEAAQAAQETKQALVEVRNAIRDASAAAKDFASIDLGHSELKQLLGEIRQVEQALRSARAAAGGGIGGVSGSPQFSPAAPSMPGIRPAPVTLPPIFPGSAAVPPSPPPASPAPVVPPSAPPSPPAGRRRRRGGGGDDDDGGLLGSIMSGAKFGLGLMGLGSIAAIAGKGVALAGEGVRNAGDDAIATDKLLRTLNDLSTGFDDLQKQVHGAASQIGISYKQMQASARDYASIAGVASVMTNASVGDRGADLMRRVGQAAGFARGYGLDVGSTTSVFARMDRAGVDPTQFAGIVGDVVREGRMDGKTDTVMNALLQWSETANRVMGTSGQTGDFAGMYAALNATGSAPFQGANASNIINTVNQSILGGGGGGMAGHILLSRAMIAEGVKDPFQQIALQQLGMFGRPSDLPGGHGDMTTFEAMRRELQQETRGMQPLDRWVLEGRAWGTNWKVAQQLDALTPAQMGGTISAMRKLGLDPTKVSGAAFAGISQVIAPGADLNAIRNTLTSDQTYGFTDEEKKRLQGESGEALRTDLIKTLAGHGLTQNLGTETSEAAAKQFNALTDAGKELLPAFNGLKTASAQLTEEMTKGLGELKKWLGDDSQGDNILGNHGGQGGDWQNAYTAIAYETGGDNSPAEIAARARSMVYGGGGGGGGSGSPLSGAERSKRAAQAMAFFQAHGYSKGAAAGIVANLIAESGLKFGVTGDNGTAHGLLQWHPDRLAAVANGIGVDPTSSFQAGLAGVLWDLQHGDPGMQIANKYLGNTDDPSVAAAEVSSLGVRPRNRYGEERARGQIAQGLMHLHDTTKVPGTTSPEGLQRVGYTQHSIQPLKVVHVTAGGQQIGVEYLPVTAAPAAMPLNT